MEEGWERPPRVELSLDELERMVQPAFPGGAIAEHAVITTGLANTNIRFRLQGRQSTYVLRLHTREPKAAAREQALMSYLGNSPSASFPVAPLVYSDPAPRLGRYPYSIWGFVEGTLLHELFKTLSNSELVDIAAACTRTQPLQDVGCDIDGSYRRRGCAGRTRSEAGACSSRGARAGRWEANHARS